MLFSGASMYALCVWEKHTFFLLDRFQISAQLVFLAVGLCNAPGPPSPVRFAYVRRLQLHTPPDFFSSFRLDSLLHALMFSPSPRSSSLHLDFFSLHLDSLVFASTKPLFSLPRSKKTEGDEDGQRERDWVVRQTIKNSQTRPPSSLLSLLSHWTKSAAAFDTN